MSIRCLAHPHQLSYPTHKHTHTHTHTQRLVDTREQEIGRISKSNTYYPPNTPTIHTHTHFRCTRTRTHTHTHTHTDSVRGNRKKRERERERERDCVCVCVCVKKYISKKDFKRALESIAKTRYVKVG